MSATWRTASLLALALTLGALAAACGDDPPTNSQTADLGGNDAGRDADPDSTPDGDAGSSDSGDCPAALDVVGSASVALGPGERAALTVFFGDCEDAPFAGESISFAIVGDAGGSQLSARSALTDGDGAAVVTLAAGSSDATFEVEATTDSGLTATFDVAVAIGGNGAIGVELSYGGRLLFDTFVPLLFEGEACEDIDPFDPPTAFLSIAAGTRITERLVFSPVPVGTDYTVTVMAQREGTSLAYGCVDGIEVAAGDATEITVLLADLPIYYEGVYELQNEFDLAGVLPPSIETTLRVLAELTDDDAIDGDPVADEWGVDPAAFLLDFVYRQLCCWEATGSSPTFESCQAQAETHGFGDLEQLYREDFRTWDGAQPRTTGLCGAIDDSFGANQIAQNFVQGLITDYVPDIVVNLLVITGDLASAFTDMRITSELIIDDVFTDKIGGNLTHRLLTMTVTLHDLDGDENTYEVDLAAAGLTNLEFSSEEAAVSVDDVLTIPEHSFQLDFGQLLAYVYRTVLLGSLDCDPTHSGRTSPCDTTAELFQTWIDCAEVGEWMADNVGLLSASAYEGFCGTGLSLAGTFIEDQIESAIDLQTVITLEGTVRVGEINELRRPVTLVDGVWEGTLSEELTSYGDFPGTFTGVRIDD
jgi:hypothetical protein